MPLSDKVAIVTGAGSGLGRAGARAFAAAGAAVVASDLDGPAAAETAALILADGGAAVAVAADAGAPADVRDLVAAAIERFGHLDVLYNNAGVALVGQDGFTADIPDDVWDRVVRVNLTSVFLCSKYAMPHLAKRPGASIVNTASSMAVLPLGLLDAYAATKGGVASLTRSMAHGCGRLGVRVNAICPGYVDTPMNALIFGDPGMREAFATDHATGVQAPEEIAELAVFLASDGARSLTGAVITCDRGWTAFKRPSALAGRPAS